MGQIIGSAAKPKRCNKNRLSQLGTPAAGEYILVSSDNSMNAAGQGNFDCYIEGDGRTAATALELQYLDQPLIDDEKVLAQALSKHEEMLNQIINSNDYLGRDEEYVIAKALNDLKDDNSSGDSGDVSNYKVTDVLTAENSDIITALGGSVGTGYFNVAGKHWIEKLSMFSDYQFRRLARDGANNTSLLQYLRSGALSFTGRYALLSCNGNTYMDMNLRLQSVCNIAEYLKTYGAEPILATSFRYSQYQSALWRQYADSHNYMFWDCAKYCKFFLSALGGKGNSGWHLGTRDSQMTTDSYMPYLERMERPYKSLKVFRKRDSVSFNSLDELVFIDNEERAKLFKELYIGGQCLADSTKVDDVSQTGSTGIANEYSLLDNGSITISVPLLVSAIIPICASSLRSLFFDFKHNKDVNVYVLNRKIEPYIRGGVCSRFSVPESINIPEQGAIYSYDGTEYTVKAVVEGENNYYCTIYCIPSISSTVSSGTLSKISGVGQNSINFILGEETTLSEEVAVESETVGHWEELSSMGGRYYLDSNQLTQCVAYDKIHFLVIPEAPTAISNIAVTSSGDNYKTSFNRSNYDFNTTYWKEGELIQEPTFVVDTPLNIWKNNGNTIVPVSDYENSFPTGCSGCVNIDDANVMECTINNIVHGGNYILEVWSRYFPPIYTDGTGNQITEDSYDYETLYVKVTNHDNSTTGESLSFVDRIGTAWKISQFRLDVFSLDTMDIRISSGNKGLEICKISLKKVD